MATSIDPYLFAFSILSIVVTYRIAIFYFHGPHHRCYPPGPKPKWIIGNLLDYPQKDAARTYRQWSLMYKSDILFTTTLGNHVVILNKRRDGDELLEKRSRLYSDRPFVPMLEMMGWDYNMASFHYGERWRRHRKICQQNFGPEGSKAYYPILIRKVNELMSDLFACPDDFVSHSKKLSLAIPMASMYGYNISSVDDPCIAPANKATSLAEEVMTDSALANLFPILRFIPNFLPGSGFKKRANEVRKVTEEMRRLPIEFVEKSVLDGTATPSLLSNFLGKKFSSGVTSLEEDAMKNVASTVYGAGSETTHSATISFFYLMIINPAVQETAQKEIDRVIGRHRLPEFEDRCSMPYIEAIYRELLRWKPPVPLGLPHRLIEDDFYNGYFIPKGTMVFANIWAMTRDEGLYRNANQFLPERFLDENRRLNNDSRVLAYGFGRRACAGKHIASSTLWLLIASTLALFKIERAKDNRGGYIRINGDYLERTALVHKVPFQCSFVPRSLEAMHLIQEIKFVSPATASTTG